MAWRDYRVLGDGGEFEVPPGVRRVGIAAFGPGGHCNHEVRALGGGGGGGMAFGVTVVEPGERLTGFVVDAQSSRFGEVLTALAGENSVDEHGGAGGYGIARPPEGLEGQRWLSVAVASGGHGGVGQRKDEWVSFGGGGGLGSFYGEGGSGGNGRLVGSSSMFGHGGGGGLSGHGGDSLAPRSLEFIDRLAVGQQAPEEEKGTWLADGQTSGPGGGGGGGVSAGGAAWANEGYLQPHRREESLGGPGGGGGSFGPGERGGVIYRPGVSEGSQLRLLATESPGQGGVGLSAVGGEARFQPGHYLSVYLPHEAFFEREVEGEGKKIVTLVETWERQIDGPDKKHELMMPVVFFTNGSGEGRTVAAPYLAWLLGQLDGGGGAGANLCGAGHGGPGAGGGGAGRLPGFGAAQGRGGQAGHGGFGGGGGGGSTIYPGSGKAVEVLGAGDGGVGGGGGGGGYRDASGQIRLKGAGQGGPGGGGGGGPDSEGGRGFFVVYW